jgi:hypothetical protein
MVRNRIGVEEESRDPSSRPTVGVREGIVDVGVEYDCGVGGRGPGSKARLRADARIGRLANDPPS